MIKLMNKISLYSFDFREAENSQYVFHPVNAFHLLERTVFISEWVSRIQSYIPFEFDVERNSLIHDYKRAHHGLADLLEYFDFNTEDLAKGTIKTDSNLVFKSKTPLISQNLINIAIEAAEEDYIEGFVNWLTTSLTIAEKEFDLKKDSSGVEYLEKIR